MSERADYPAEFLARLAKVTSRRARVVIDHILKHGRITTEELERDYGYSHPPRAARDVRELGIPLVTRSVRNAAGLKIAEYRFGDPSQVRRDRLDGRKTFPKAFKSSVQPSKPRRCDICQTPYEDRFLQIDHRVPYEVAGDEGPRQRDPGAYMLLCAACQRSKSWSCEHCDNWREARLPEICKRCYWARPESYEHVALKEIRRVDIVWLGEEEVEDHARLRELAAGQKVALPLYAKAALAEHARRSGG